MELMIKYSEFLTIIVQAFLITVAGFIFVGCGREFLEDLKRSSKLLRKRKGGKRKLREYSCPNCGFGAWALDRIHNTNCNRCGSPVKTKPVPKFEKSLAFGRNDHSEELTFLKK